MTTDNQKQNTKNPFMTYAIIFVVGFLCGVGFTIYKIGGTSGTSTTTSQVSNSQDAAMHEAILSLEAEVTSDPKNFQAWKKLGDSYYDHNEPQKAINAYTKSLELHSGDANLLTDLGVMYRKTEKFNKAIESFDKAREMDPTHEPSRFNKGIVLMYDLKDKEGAIESWEELLRINPDAHAGNGESIRAFVDSLKVGTKE